MGVRLTIMNRMDRARMIAPRKPAFALVGVAGFVAYVAAVIGGSVVQQIIAPGLAMGWFQQIGGLIAVSLVAMMLADRRAILGLEAPIGRWLAPAILCGLAITAIGTVTGLAMGDEPKWHGVEHFLYEATLPGLSEELGFRGLLLGTLLASFPGRGRRWALIGLAAVPFAALHLLESTGMEALMLAIYTFAAGMMLGRLRLATGSILPCIVAHNVANVGSGLVDHLLLMLR